MPQQEQRKESPRRGPFGVKGLIRKRNTFYYQGSMVNGMRPHAVCLHTNDLTQAIIEADRVRTEQEIAASRMMMLANETGNFVGHGKSARASGNVRMSQLIDLYLSEKKKAGDFRPATSSGNSLMLRQSCKVMNDPLLGNLGQRELRAYSNWLKNPKQNPGRSGEGLSEATVHTYLNRLRCFFSWAVQTGRLAKSPMAEVKIGRVRVTKIHDFCTIEEREALLAQPCAIQDVKTILHLGFFAGLRFMEMQALRWCDVQDEESDGDGERMHLMIRAHSWFIPKGKAARVVPAPARLRQYLRGIKTGNIVAESTAYVIAPENPWHAKLANGYRFNPKKSFKELVKRSGIKKSMSYHTLRHSYITHHLNAGTSMSLISQWTGDDEETLRTHYAGYCPDVSKVEAIG